MLIATPKASLSSGRQYVSRHLVHLGRFVSGRQYVSRHLVSMLVGQRATSHSVIVRGD